MTPALSIYPALGLAIVLEVAGTTLLPFTRGFTRLGPTAGALLCYAVSFYFLSQVVRVLPVGIVYAIWSGLGVALIVLAGWVFFRQSLDGWAALGVGLIVAGVLIINLLSRSAAH